MKVVGLTGGIGSGKTTVANFFKELAIPVYIADTEAKRLMNSSPEVRDEIKRQFGERAYTKTGLNKSYLASQVFQDKNKLELLNSIVHPAVRNDFKTWSQGQTADYVIYESAILFEKGGYRNCDYTILVTAAFEHRIERLQKRDSSSMEEIEARMSHQWPDETKEKLANFIIRNNDLSLTYEKVKEIHGILINEA